MSKSGLGATGRGHSKDVSPNVKPRQGFSFPWTSFDRFQRANWQAGLSRHSYTPLLYICTQGTDFRHFFEKNFNLFFNDPPPTAL